jgi:hypothetical protein
VAIFSFIWYNWGVPLIFTKQGKNLYHMLLPLPGKLKKGKIHIGDTKKKRTGREGLILLKYLFVLDTTGRMADVTNQLMTSC